MSKAVIEKIAELVTAAFGLVAALAWNEAIKGWFETSGLAERGGPWIYAVIVTIVAVVATLWIGRVAERVSRDEKSLT